MKKKILGTKVCGENLMAHKFEVEGSSLFVNRMYYTFKFFEDIQLKKGRQSLGLINNYVIF